ncbi:MAG: FtsX-like permease family protein [Actinobacteria bacterium]|nr:FtsX-like permease family protein [Actinomycetota bacterium]MCG2817510.1 FtsX-like permease family protein [Actinomycetes bacterium]MBU4219133.1 FtsX-like permease family protein [Actinomycetota bacterium]MBU4358420.1 FtsX-like permease family protein [Actinomycetota bacterium]MBU4392856.1 FtsX-like permease family protein [Actinomycetota bacterium]
MKIKKPEMNTMRLKLVREILNAKVRFMAITLVVVIGVAIFIASSMSYRNLDTSYEYTYDQLNFADFRVKADDIPGYVVEKAGKVPGVTMVTPRARADKPFIMTGGKHLVGRVTGLPYEQPFVDDLIIKEGRYFEPGDSMVCIAESHFAGYYDVHPGDTIYYDRNGAEIPVEIIGVAGNPEYLVLAGEKGDFSPILSASAMAILWMPIRDVQEMTQLPDSYNQLLFKVDNPENMEPQIAAVEEIMKYTGIQNIITQDEHQGNVMMKADLESFKSFALFFPLMFLLIACFSIYILLSRLVYTQRPFVGVMRAIGYTKKQILFHYLSFALVIGVLGAFVGAALGYVLSSLITSVYAGTMGIPMTKIKTYWSVIFQGMTLSMVFCAIAGIMPAIRSARLDPSKAMRGETLEVAYRRPLLERVFPPMSRLPLFLKVPFRNMSRNRRRTAFTIIGLVFSVMIVLVFLATLDTAAGTLERGFHYNNRFDMVVMFLGGRDEALITKIRRVHGVTDVEPTLGYNCTVAWDGDSAETVMMGIIPSTRMKYFYTSDGQQVKLTGRHVLMNQWFNMQKGLEVGDTVNISTEYRDKDFIVGEFIEEPMGNLIYIPAGEARELLAYGMGSRGAFYVKTKPGAYTEVRNELQEFPGMAAIIDLEEIKREIESYMSLLYIIVYVMLAFALVMAFTLTFNTVTINILEREREIATIRTIGTESWKISAMTTMENVIFGLLSIIPGIILGVMVGRYAMSLQQTDYFSMTLEVSARSYILVSVGIIVILILCQIPSLQYVKRVHLAEATKERGG